MQIKIPYLNRFFVLSSILSFLLFIYTKNNLFILVILLINVVYSMTFSVLNTSFSRLIRSIKDNFYSITLNRTIYPIKEINDFNNLIKSFISHEKLIEAVNLTLSKNSDSDIFYKVVVENLGLILGTPHLAFILYNPIIRKYEVTYGNGYFIHINEFADYNYFETISDHTTINPNDYSKFINLDEFPDFKGIKNLGIINLTSSLNYRGYVVFGSSKDEITAKLFEKYNFMLLEIATSFNSHINNKMLKEKISELHLLNKIITLMETNKDIEEVFRLFMTHLTAKEGLSFNRAILFNKEGNSLSGMRAVGPLNYEEANRKWQQLKTCPIDMFLEKSSVSNIEAMDPLEKLTKESILQIVEDPLISEIIFTKKHMVIEFKNANFSIDNKKALAKFNLKKFIIAPLISYDNCLGVVIIDNAFDNKYFSEERISSLLNVTSQTSLVVNNLLLYIKIKNMAIKDELTKLYNRRFFEEQLTLEIERATRHKTSLSLIMIDIDYFKNYNDKNGHVAGDYLLSTISSIFKDTCRSSDYVCRYGGEEFSIILPETDIIGAYEVADKIRKKVYSNIFQYGEHQPNKRLTVSLGISTFPQLAGDKMELKERSDRALYHSKRTGRNKSTIYSEDIEEAMLQLQLQS